MVGRQELESWTRGPEYRAAGPVARRLEEAAPGVRTGIDVLLNLPGARLSESKWLPIGTFKTTIRHMAPRRRRSAMARTSEHEEARVAFDPLRHAAPALAGLFRIMEIWGAGKIETMAILGQPSERTFYRWKAGDVVGLPHDVIRRIGYVSGIWKALQVLYSNSKQADEWVQKPNRFFGGQTPLERMSAGDVTDLAAVHQYLDAARAPWS